jgi:ubiquinone/menaquinone biosynthesis C-methylase UbiE
VNNKLDKEVLENHQRYLERNNFYKRLGCDIDQERKFILDKAQPLFGDILEVGTGRGHFALTLARKGYRFVSVDVCEEAQKIAKLNLRYFGLEGLADFRIENAESLSFQDKSFDLIFSINTFHHLINPFIVMDELIRVLTFEGKIILSDFTKEGLDLMDKIHRSEGRIHEVSEVALSDIEKYLLGKGFITTKERSEFQQIVIACHQII